MGSYYLNIILLIISFALITGYVLLVIYFSDLYRKTEPPYINSNNNVISNKEITEIVDKVKVCLDINEYNVNYGKDIKYTNFGRGIKFKKKEIDIARLPLTSVGYELDYVISRLWYVSKLKHEKRLVLPFSIMMNYLINIFIVLIGLLFIVQLVIFCYGASLDKGLNITNTGMKILWQYPIFFVLIVSFIFSIIFMFYLLKIEKENMEQQYNKDTIQIFNTVLDNYKYDFKSARVYSAKIKIGYNFAIHSKKENRLIKWIGPFSNY